jgi:two-component system, sensor histidine kinase PdtaS
MPRTVFHIFKNFIRINKAINLLFIFIPAICFPQISKNELKSQRLRMQLGAGYLNVATQNQVDLDSGLYLAATRNHLKRMIVIGENYDDIITNPANSWVLTENLSEAKNLAATSEGAEKIQLFNIIGLYYAFQPLNRKNNIDSSLKYLLLAKQGAESLGNKKLLCQTLIGLGKCYLKANDLALAGRTFSLAINIAVASGYKSEQAMALAFWGAYSPFQPGTIMERIEHLKSALSIYQDVGNTEDQIIALTDIGYLTFASGKMKESAAFFEKALSLENKIKFPYTHFNADLLCLISTISNDGNNKVKYGFQELRAVEATHDSTALAYIYSRMATVERGNPMAKQDEVLSWYQKSLDEFIRTKDMNMYNMVENIAELYKSDERSSETIPLYQRLLKNFPPSSPVDKFHAYTSLGWSYIMMGDFDKAEEYYLMAEEIQKDAGAISGNIGLYRFYGEMTRLYFELKKYSKSRYYYQLAQTFPKDNATPNFVATTEQIVASMDSAEGNYKEAYRHSQFINSLILTYYHDEDLKKVNEIRVQYETEKKDSSIKILNQQSALQNAEIIQDKRAREFMIAGAGVLLLILGLVYNQYRLKQKQQKEISEKNISLQQLVEDKEFLMKEIHHRVKNNLQIVISLLNTQSKFLNNEEAIAAISESRHRMQAMSLIHQKLYQSENAAFVAMPGYIRELVDYLDTSFNVGQKIRFELEIDPIDLDISQAIPVGLILNEAVTNCIKHAFTDQANGIIRVTMKDLLDKKIFLEISDNGKGLPPDFDFTTSQSLGIRLMRGLIEQIGGVLQFSDRDGCRIATEFAQDLVLKPVAV